jgi:MFS family permease
MGKEDLTTTKRPAGMFGFSIVWVGQIVSMLASNMSWFALTIWAFEKTGSATVLGSLQTAFILPFLLISPFSGALVDRYNRKLMMMVSDFGAVIATGAILVLNAGDLLEIWHLVVASIIYGVSGSFQWPAYSAAISTMVPKEQYTRANGMMSLIESGPAVFSPMLAGAFLPIIGLTGILTLDVITFGIAIAALLVVHIPQPKRTEEGQAGKGNLMQEAIYGFKYIFERRGLMALLTVIMFLNFVHGFSGGALFTPLILTRTGNNTISLGAVQSAFAIGGVVGGLVVTAWGGLKKNRIRGMLIGWSLFALFGLIFFGLGRGLSVWIPMAVLSSMTFPFTQSASNAIWQSKVAPDVQGRVFSARRLIAWLMDPIMPVVAGATADYVTEPAMTSQTALASLFGGLVGTDPGAGMSLQYVFSGVAYILIIVVAWFIPRIRNVETDMPDHDQLKEVEGEGDAE